ncbi:nitrite reductase small subunit NirD [Streptomyces griseocarneus]|uniref:nitrite reductase small subunit NirD n=1 Tax=Streptomyces griseocarneus TaxID=51201 RepID=UPI00167D5CA2|nr:nitrite reductase small subunit NirD [Streptomyces griseocarneus]MBZ6474245.1 nitrite reductase small subunit NirD [Streptomyces griseocarneus]GHG52838.1 nitrite reductase small subunit [Streptomyces griseocarneus]
MTGPLVEIAPGTGGDWRAVCAYHDLLPGRGAAVLVDGHQIALFRDRGGAVYAVGNRDPFSGAHVISRGILGSRGTAPVVVSPMYKQAFDLRTGACLDEPAAPGGEPAALPVWRVRLTPAASACAGDVAPPNGGAHRPETARS